MQTASIRVRVPATSANLGPGFDSLGLAFQLFNFVSIGEASSGRDEVSASGEGESTLARDATNIALIAAKRLLQHIGAPRVALQLHLENHIPLSRGLGSSAAARVGAIVAANEWAKTQGWRAAEPLDLLALATDLEGHPDNIAAAQFGGLTASAMDHRPHANESPVHQSHVREADVRQLDDAELKPQSTFTAPATDHRSPATGPSRVWVSRLPIAAWPKFVIFIPETELETKTARAVLPDAVFRADANFNIARTALLLSSLVNGDWQLLPEALKDKLHEEHRAVLMPGFHAIVHAAREAGAYAATLSGAGPTILAWLPPHLEVGSEVCQAMQDVAAEHEVFGHAREIQVDRQGCVRA